MDSELASHNGLTFVEPTTFFARCQYQAYRSNTCKCEATWNDSSQLMHRDQSPASWLSTVSLRGCWCSRSSVALRVKSMLDSTLSLKCSNRRVSAHFDARLWLWLCGRPDIFAHVTKTQRLNEISLPLCPWQGGVVGLHLFSDRWSKNIGIGRPLVLCVRDFSEHC